MAVRFSNGRAPRAEVLVESVILVGLHYDAGKPLPPATNGTASAAAASPAAAAGELPPRVLPEYDPKLRRLSYGGVVLLTIRGDRTRYDAILDAFQRQHWEELIDDPLPQKGVVDPPRRRRDAIGDLNRAIKAAARALRPSPKKVPKFKADGTGQGIRWWAGVLVKRRRADLHLRSAARHTRRVAGVSV
ncbi:MAG TPA: hypothetical protein VJ783_07300 [Pirellulales bacterium]|nr:hypothetical protein [Pirellulales bacterium]